MMNMKLHFIHIEKISLMSTLYTAAVTSGVAVNDVCIKWKVIGAKNERPSFSTGVSQR